MADVSVASLPCFSLDEKILQILWDEGVQMEELLEFSFERVGKLAAERGVELDDAHKEELWLYVQRMKAEQPDWVSLSHYQDRSSRQLFDSCLEDFTGATHFHTAQLTWDTSSWNQSCHASFSQDSLETTALPFAEINSAGKANSVKTKSSKRTCKMPKTFRLSKCDLSPISPKPRAPVRRSRSKVAALLSRLVRERTAKEPQEDRFFTRGIWPSWLNFNTTPKQSSPTAQGNGRSSAALPGRQRTPLLLRWLGRKRSHGYRVSTVRQRP
ncbi:uncharacterized protein LOC142585011 [Dermacentor variabilis]|uniref:uncharacterized protein LOC142585011 n=1 Tax=Dermacentor variabilis TaxID=34621 RepID=UPI003F5B52A4